MYAKRKSNRKLKFIPKGAVKSSSRSKLAPGDDPSSPSISVLPVIPDAVEDEKCWTPEKSIDDESAIKPRVLPPLNHEEQPDDLVLKLNRQKLRMQLDHTTERIYQVSTIARYK